MMRSNIAGETRPNAEHDLQVFGMAEVQEMVEAGYGVIPLVEKMELNEHAGALYERLRNGSPSFLMDSAETDERQGRYSFIGLEPESIIRLEADGMMVNGERQEFDDPYDFVDEMVTGRKVAPVEGLPPYFGGAAGLFGYDLARYREPTIGEPNVDPLGLPDMALIVPKITIALDHYKQELSIISNLTIDSYTDLNAVADKYQESVAAIASMKQRILAPEVKPKPKKDYGNLSFSSNMSEDEFKATVLSGIEHAEAGDIFQVVPSQRFSSDKPVDGNFAHEAFKRLKRLNPSRHAFLYDFGDFQVAGCSPETLVKVTDGQVEHMAIAGTRKRGKDVAEDLELADDLLHDSKETAEHAMLVDLSRNDVSKVCVPDSVSVPEHMVVENYSHVMHLTSTVIGELANGKTALDALASIAPAGTLSGAPKIRAMQIIDEMEPVKRGFYGGAVGYINPSGNLDSCIFIRSLIVDKEGYVHVQSGAGVVVDSDPQSELEETVMKAAAPIAAIEAVGTPAYKPQSLAEELSVNRRRFSGLIRPNLKRALLIDNYDSYVPNVARYLSMSGLGVSVEIVRNDISAKEMIDYKPDLVIVSPGPGEPKDAGLSMKAMTYFPEKGVPTLGICLGHQALVAALGGEIVRHKPMHGKGSKVVHDEKTIFAGLPNPLEAMRYHSLVAEPESLPSVLDVSAHVYEGGENVIMAVRHSVLPAEGVQFHPESRYTLGGQKIIDNFVGYNRDIL